MKLSLYGNRPLILVRDPQLPMEAATKNYVDFQDNLHATNASLHLTEAQNTLLDSLTVSSTEINHLTGITGNIQDLLNLKFDKAGGNIGGNVTLGDGFGVFVNKVPSSGTELVNKAYVDAIASGQKWKDPVTDINLVNDSLSAPPANPVINDVYIIGAGATGAWATKDGYATYWDGTQWVYLQARPVQPGDRFGVALVSSTTVSSSLTAHAKKTVTVAGVSPYTYTADAVAAGTAVLVFDEQSSYFGVSYAFTDESTWVPTNTSVNIAPGSGLSLSGNILNTNLGSGLTDVSDYITVDLHGTSGLWTTENGTDASSEHVAKLSIRLKGTTLSKDSDGLFLSTSVVNDIADRVSRTSATTVTGTTTYDSTGSLVVNYTPTANNQVVPKSYIDDINTTLSDSITTINNTVNTLNTDPVTKTYVDTQDNKKLNLTGGTLTGALTLHADPVDDLHAATKSYVDGRLTNLTSSVTSGLAEKVNKSGDTMTGALVLHGAPTEDLHAATKKYTDDLVATERTAREAADTTLTTNLTTVTNIVNTLNSDPVTKAYVDSQDGLKVNKAGDTLTGYLTLHADPTQALHPASKQYVDNVASGLTTKPSARVATTGNLNATYVNGSFGVNATLTGTANGALVIDGVNVIVGDRVLVRAQTNEFENGSYTVQQIGDGSTPFILKRVEAVNESAEIPGSYYYVYDGLTLKATGWVAVVANPVTFAVGADAIEINQFSGQGSIIAGAGLTLSGNTLDINTANPARIVVNADSIDLATTAVTPGTYTKLTVDGYGRVTDGANPNTIAGYGITDAQPLNANLTSLSGVSSHGIVVRNNSDELVTKSITVSGNGLSITNADGGDAGNIAIASNATNLGTASTVVYRDTNGDFTAHVVTADLVGNASTATALKNARSFSVSGDATTAAGVSFDGTGNVDLAITLNDTGITAGDYFKTTVNAKGLVTAGSNPTTLAGFGITDGATKEELAAEVEKLNAKIDELVLMIMSKM